jgi:hypothetical protein
MILTGIPAKGCRFFNFSPLTTHIPGFRLPEFRKFWLTFVDCLFMSRQKKLTDYKTRGLCQKAGNA